MAHNQEALSKTQVIRFKDQDFNSLRDYCLSRGLLFEDEMFPAEISSIGPQLLQGRRFSSLQWKRPKDLLMGRSEPHFILEGASRFDIQQGDTGDCWFLAALGSLTQNPEQLQKILINQSFSHQYAGIFRFLFWQCGQWVEVVVDDRLPLLDKKYLFVNPLNNQEFWPCLLEKAYAKFHGSYLRLHYGYLPDALVDLTGGVVTSIDLHTSPSDLVMMVKTAAKAGSLMTCATPAGPTGKALTMENGLVSQHAYTVTGTEQVQYRRGWENLIRLWNPWGNTEWCGRWGDRSPEWQETQDPRKSKLYENKNDGEFWMSCRDFQENFSCLYICNQFPVNLYPGHMAHERWSQITLKSYTTPGNTTEGFERDTQYIFSVSERVEGNNVIVSCSIAPQNLNIDEKFPLNFHVFKVDPQFQHFREKLPSAFFSHFRNAEKGIVTRTKRNLTKCFTLSLGTYVVAVSECRKAVELLLRIFLKMPDADGQVFQKMALNKAFSTDMLGRHLEQDQSNIILQNLQALLRGCALQEKLKGLGIDATQLQKLLNQEFLNGPPGDAFSLDECRSIVALMDLKVNGQLDHEEFPRLWSRLVRCQSVFQNSRRSSGVFLSLDLWRAVRDTDFLAGVSVSSELLDLMALRYSDRAGRVSFPSLVCFLMRLEAMAKVFQNLSKDGKGLYLTEMEWMSLVMYS